MQAYLLQFINVINTFFGRYELRAPIYRVGHI